MASATATRYGLNRGLLGLEYDRINISDSNADSELNLFQQHQYHQTTHADLLKKPIEIRIGNTVMYIDPLCTNIFVTIIFLNC